MALCSECCCGNFRVEWPRETFPNKCRSLIKGKLVNSTISKLFDRSLQIIWPNGIKHDKILFLLNDSASYMVKTGKVITVFYSKMERVTCLTHALHKVTEEIGKIFPKVNQRISNCKKIFLRLLRECKYLC
jgi:hypothetical protein|uniref:DUF659 domain-containing protein n=1 Tax=Sipha flava TaxID=143950 RepID=A0A2S2R514_9HEMI